MKRTVHEGTICFDVRMKVSSEDEDFEKETEDMQKALEELGYEVNFSECEYHGSEKEVIWYEND